LLKNIKKQWYFKIISSLFLLIIIYACSDPDNKYLVYIGTYTGDGSDGIYAYRLDPLNGVLDSIGLVAETESPSFLAIDSKGKFLYAVNEIDSFQNKASGAISVFAIDKESGNLKLLQQVPSVGAAPAHLSLDMSGRYLLVANYNGGSVAVFPIESDGKLDSCSAFIQNVGSSVNPERQTSPHAHFVQVTDDNRFAMVADLGLDKILLYKFDETNGSLVRNDPEFIMLDAGSGPRHFAFTPSGKFVYVLNELSSTVSVFSFESKTGMMETKQTVSTLPKNFTGQNTAAEILVDTKGKFLYVSNRGDDSIVLFNINSDDGSIKSVEWISSGGKTPRNFEIDPTGQWLFAANQNSDNIVIFRIDPISGRLNRTTKSYNIISPVCIRFVSTD